jgi:hypothetical protein
LRSNHPLHGYSLDPETLQSRDWRSQESLPKRKIGRGSPNIFVPITAAMRPNYWNAAADIVKPRRRKSASATGELLSQTDLEYLRDLFTRLGLANPQCE